MQLTINNRRIGDVDKGILIKKGSQVVKFHKYNGFGIPASVVRHPAIQGVELHYEGQIYRASCRTVLSDGILHKTEGYEEQYVLPTKFWDCERPNQIRMPI